MKAYVAAGHHVYMEKGAGVGSGFSDDEYMHAGASLIDNAADVWHLVDMMVKVKEPLECEYPLFHDGLILYTYLHLAADDAVTQLMSKGYIKRTGKKDRIYQVTAEGYSIADAFRNQNNLDPSKEPSEILAEFGDV